MIAFITGSRVYGRPGPGSDIDLVIRCDEATAEALRKASDPGPSIRFGKLNVLVCTTDEEYRVWLEGTRQLKLLAPIGKTQAKKLFDDLRERYGVQDNYRNRADSTDPYPKDSPGHNRYDDSDLPFDSDIPF